MFSKLIKPSTLFYSSARLSHRLSHSTLDSVFIHKLMNPIEYKEKIQNFQMDDLLKNPLKNFERLNELKKSNSEILMSHLDPQCLSKIQSLNSDLPACEMVIIKKFPFTETSQINEAEQMLLGFSYLLNMTAFTYKNEYSGRLLHHIRPRLEEQFLSHSASSKAELKLHTENSFDENRPDYLVLYCVKSNLQAMTTFLSLSKLLKTLEERKSEFLLNGMKKSFIHLTPPSHDIGSDQAGELFYRLAKNSIGIRYGHGLIKGSNKESEKLLEELEEKMFDQRDGITLEPGDLCIWSNHTVLHGRSAYNTTFNDENKRFLVRMYLSRKDLPIVRS